nr:zinc finger, CCHC-type [Tanacetum cinerariifolium]
MWYLFDPTPSGSITTWEDLTTRFLAQFFPPGRTIKLSNDILMFQQHQGEFLSEAWTHFKDLLQKVPLHGIDLWLQVQIFYDHIDQTLKKTLDYAVEGLLRKLSAEKAWATIEKLAQYKDEGWNGPVILNEGNLDFNPTLSNYRGYDPKHLGVKFKLGGEPKEMPLLELGWSVGLYSKRKSRENATLSGLSMAETVASIRNPRVNLAHQCIATTISGRKESTNRVTEIELYYLYCIYTKGVVSNIPYWLASMKQRKRLKGKPPIWGDGGIAGGASQLDSGGGVIDLIGDEDPTDEDGDTGMDDSTGVSTSLGGEISSGEKKFRESDIGDCDNTGDGSKTAGRTIITWGGEIVLYACMASIYGSSCKGEKICMSKSYLAKSFEELGELFLGIVGK